VCSLVLSRKKKVWNPYSVELSEKIENSFSSLRGVGIADTGDGFRFNFTQWISSKSGANKDKTIHRATWFYKDEKNAWYPYDKETTEKLEAAVQNATSNFRVEVTHKPLRYVVLHADGTFKQYRATEKANREGRDVIRGWEGKYFKKAV